MGSLRRPGKERWTKELPKIQRSKIDYVKRINKFTKGCMIMDGKQKRNKISVGRRRCNLL